jgi:hypothetical protein
MAYNYLTQYNSPNYTPGADTASVWGVNRQLRDIVIHHWGDPATNPTFEGVIAHLDDSASQVSAHYVATGDGRRVACLVSPADNAWATDGENPYSIAIECDPRCRPEDYDVVAELIADIRSAYGNMPLKPHKQFWNTSCPGNWDLTRLDSLSRQKVSQAEWGQVTDLNPPVTLPAPQPTPSPSPGPVIIPTPVPVVLPPVVTPKPTPIPVVDPPVVRPPVVVPAPPAEVKANPFRAALVELLRMAIFSLPAALIQVLTNNPNLTLGYGGTVLVVLKYIDAYIQANPDINLKGLLNF